jgi:hypothetical protein
MNIKCRSCRDKTCSAWGGSVNMMSDSYQAVRRTVLCQLQPPPCGALAPAGAPAHLMKK